MGLAVAVGVGGRRGRARQAVDDLLEIGGQRPDTIEPRLLRLAIKHFGHRVSEPEIKLLLVVLFGLGGLATQAGSEAVLPAYVAGLVIAGVFLHDRVLMDRLRSIAFALLTPFFFLRAGTLISAPALVTGAGVIGALLLVKLAAKLIGVWPVAAAFKMPKRERTYTTLLMATGLTFGSIAALYGLTHGLISHGQYTELVTVVILSAFVPTLIAQQLFRPGIVDAEEEEELFLCVSTPLRFQFLRKRRVTNPRRISPLVPFTKEVTYRRQTPYFSHGSAI